MSRSRGDSEEEERKHPNILPVVFSVIADFEPRRDEEGVWPLVRRRPELVDAGRRGEQSADELVKKED